MRMQIVWKRVLLLACVAGLCVLLLRGFLLARCAPKQAAEDGEDVVITVYDHREEARLTMPLEDYIMGVVAAEMPASFPLEAIKAQCVAARTYTAYHMLHEGCKRYDADVCTSSACCQAYCSDERMKARWGEDYADNREKLMRATRETAREVLLYEGAPIEALYHSASGGRTENVEDVYSAALPYLRSVMSTAEAGTTKLTGERTLSLDALCEAVNGKWPAAKLTKANAARQVEILETTASGRVKRVRLGGVTVAGRQLRSLLSLDSALFTVTFAEDSVTFDTKGYGHGVGMSQTGANVMALGGRGYREILQYYYTDVAIGTIALS